MNKVFLTLILLSVVITSNADFKSFLTFKIGHVTISENPKENILIYRLNDKNMDTLEISRVICGGGSINLVIEVRNYQDSLIVQSAYSKIGDKNSIKIPLKKYIDMNVKGIKIYCRELKYDEPKFTKICEVRFDDGNLGRKRK